MSDVNSIIYAYLEMYHPNVKEEVCPIEQLQLRQLIDSIDMLNLLFFLEERFHISIGDNEVVAENFETLASLVRLVENKTK